MPETVPAPPGPTPLVEVGRLFLRLGATSFGGPAAHIAMPEDEVVSRRGWVSRERFLDLLGAANLIPGPNSTELAMHLGFVRAGWGGLLVAGSAFILPALIVTTSLAWAYVHAAGLPALAGTLAGVRAALLAFIAGTVWRLGRSAIKTAPLALLAALVLLGSAAGAGEIVLLLGGGLIGALWVGRRSSSGLLAGLAPVWLMAGPDSTAHALTLAGLGLFFLKVGAVLYGSGYVLVAFLEGGLVERLGWLTRTQLLDAVAAGQFTPGPVLSTAAFVGYLLFGLPGAAVAGVGIFLPSFLLVAATAPLMPHLRRNAWTGAFLDAVNVAALALMAAAAARLGAEAVGRPAPALIALGALVATVRFAVHPGWLVLAGGLAGWLVMQ